MPDPITLLIELLFAILFAVTAWRAVRSRDPLARDLALVFSGFAGLFVIELITRTIGKPPAVVSAAAVVLLLIQPVFTLKLVADVRSVHRWLLPVATLASFGTVSVFLEHRWEGLAVSPVATTDPARGLGPVLERVG